MTLSAFPPHELRQGGSPVLETERLLLRAPRLDDAAAIAKLTNDRRVAENAARIPHPYTASDAEGFIASTNVPGGEVSFAVTMRDETLVGVCGLRAATANSAELGYWLGVPFWGKGIGTEAVRALVDHAFTELGQDVLTGGARVTNPASRRVLEKCGFQWTGVGLYRIRAIASSAPIDRFRLDRGIWASLKSWRDVRRLS